MTIRTAKAMLGRDYASAMKRWKELTIEARRAGNDDVAAVLSEAKQLIKRNKPATCARCGCVIIRTSAYCRMCWLQMVFRKNRLRA